MVTMELAVQPPQSFFVPNGSAQLAFITATFRTTKFARSRSARRSNQVHANAGSPPDVVAFSESPSSIVFEKVYVPRNIKLLLKW